MGLSSSTFCAPRITVAGQKPLGSCAQVALCGEGSLQPALSGMSLRVPEERDCSKERRAWGGRRGERGMQEEKEESPLFPDCSSVVKDSSLPP